MKIISTLLLIVILTACSSSSEQSSNLTVSNAGNNNYPDTLSEYTTMLENNSASSPHRSLLINIYQSVTEQNLLDQGIRIADSYMQFGSTKQDISSAKAWYELLADAGVLAAKMKLSEFHLIAPSEHIEPNIEEATKWRNRYYTDAPDLILANDIQVKMANITVLELAKLGVNVTVGDVNYTPENAPVHELINSFYLARAEEERIARFDSSKLDSYRGTWVVQNTDSAEACTRVSSLSLVALMESILVNVDIDNDKLAISSVVMEDVEQKIVGLSAPFGPTVLVGTTALAEDLGTGRYYLMLQFINDTIKISANPLLLLSGWPFAIEAPELNDLVSCNLVLKRQAKTAKLANKELEQQYQCALKGDMNCQLNLMQTYMDTNSGNADFLKAMVWAAIADHQRTGKSIAQLRQHISDADEPSKLMYSHGFDLAEECLASEYKHCPSM